MKIDVRGRHIEVSDALYTQAERRLRFALGRFGSRVLQATVLVSDANGPRGGIDKHCRITVTLSSARQVMVEVMDADLSSAVDRAAGRSGRAVARELERQHDYASRKPATSRISAALFFRRQERTRYPQPITSFGSQDLAAL